MFLHCNECDFNLLVLKDVSFCFAKKAIDAPGGFLLEWWSVFWDIFIARTNEKHSDVAASYIEVLVAHASWLLLVLVVCLHSLGTVVYCLSYNKHV